MRRLLKLSDNRIDNPYEVARLVRHGARILDVSVEDAEGPLIKAIEKIRADRDGVGEKIPTIEELAEKNKIIIPDGEAKELMHLIRHTVSEFFTEYVEWWMETALEQFRRTASEETERIARFLYEAYLKDKNMTLHDVERLIDLSMFRQGPETRITVRGKNND